MKRGEFTAVCVVLLAWAGTVWGATLHVEAAGGGRFTSIQAALDAAVAGRDRIEVGPGTYYEAIDFRGKAVELYSRRGPAVTIIDGTGHTHVVRCITGEGPATILRGFTITGGDARGGDVDGYGGGTLILSASPSVADCVFAGNSATCGGGMANLTGHPSVTNCTFRGNSAADGGALYNTTSSPTLSGCAFCDNVATRGGGICNYLGHGPTVLNCRFCDNRADLGGGLCSSHSDALVAHCIFRGNEAASGGGLAGDTSNLTVTGCTFLENTAANAGGGIANGDGSALVTHCTFHHNVARHGGGLEDALSYSLVTNCLFTANAADYGGGMGILSSDPLVTHCTFSGNTAEVSGGGIRSNGIGSTTTVTNCVLWSNRGGQMETGVAAAVVTSSDVQDGWPGAGNIDADPRFVDAAGRDYHLAPGSPCIDTGTNTPPGGLPATDLEGNPRPLDGNGDGVAVADMGAYEMSSATAAQLLADLIAEVLDLRLEPAVRASLMAPLYTALRLVTDGTARNDASAAGALQGFLRTVAADRGTRLAAPDADALSAAAQAIIDRLGGV